MSYTIFLFLTSPLEFKHQNWLFFDILRVISEKPENGKFSMFWDFRSRFLPPLGRFCVWVIFFFRLQGRSQELGNGQGGGKPSPPIHHVSQQISAILKSNFRMFPLWLFFCPSLFDAFAPRGRVIAPSPPSPFWLRVYPSTKNTLENLRH